MIRSAQNRRIKDIRRLLRSKGDTALLEGPHLVAEALEADIPLTEILVTAGFLASADGRQLAARFSTPALEVADEVLETFADADSPRGVLALARLPRGGVNRLPERASGIYVLAEGLQDPGNLGALARTCEAAGVSGLALTAGCAHPNHPRALRASAGSLLRLPVAVMADQEALRAHLAPLRPLRVALVPRDGMAVYDFDPDGALILMLGGEGPGLSAAMLAAAEQRVTIPVAAPVESLNATVAAAVVLFELARRRAAG